MVKLLVGLILSGIAIVFYACLKMAGDEEEKDA